MNKLKQYDFILITFVLLGIRAIIVEPGVGFALTSLAFASLVGFKRWQDAQSKPDVSAEIMKELSDLRTSVGGIVMKNAMKTTNHSQQQEIKRFF